MFKIGKLLLYAVIILAVIFLYWFLPKYSFVKKNPGFCTNLTNNIYYCGTKADLNSLFETSK